MINERFVPYSVNLNKRAGEFGRFNVAWTPTVVIASPKGVEQYRIEGYLPPDEFRAQLLMGLARVEFMSKHFDGAKELYSRIAQEHASSFVEPEALYWRAVADYNQSRSAEPLEQVAKELSKRFGGSVWAVKASIWQPAETPASRASLK